MKYFWSLFAFTLGVFFIFFGYRSLSYESRGYQKTTAVIQHMELVSADAESDSYNVYVKYTVNGMTYMNVKLDYYQSGFTEGKEITILYNPNDPNDIHGDSKLFGILLIIAGGISIIYSGVSLIRIRYKIQNF